MNLELIPQSVIKSGLFRKPKTIPCYNKHMRIQVFGQRELVSHIQQKKKVFSHLISIGNPLNEKDPREDNTLPETFNQTFKDNILRLEFWDAEDAKELRIDQMEKLPQISDIEAVLDFIEKTKDTATGYTLHCWRGVSRSGAIAYGILYYFLRDEMKASDALVSIRRQVMPHKQICQWFDEIYGSHLADLGKTIYRSRMKAVRNEL